MCRRRTYQTTDSPHSSSSSSSSSSVETENGPLRFYFALQFSGASTSKGDSGASTSKGDAGASTSKGDAGASTSKGDAGASTSIGDSGSSTSSENGFYGPAGAAALLFARDREDSDRFAAPLHIFRQGLGNQTISVAEYRGLILGLKETIRRRYTDITVEGSSELVVNQFLGNWEINDPELRSLCDEALELRNSFESFSIIHIDQNLSDAVHNQATRAISLPDGQVEVEDDDSYND